MVRITGRFDPSATEQVLLVEGSLIGPWVDELQNAVASAVASYRRVRIDMSHVQFVDARGLILLRSLQGQSISLYPLSPFVRELLLERKS